MYAIAEFGSTCRNMSDKHSDRDLLIVCHKNMQLVLYRKYEKQGYSVSVLSPEQLAFMKKQGSLFLQHLKKEAKILIDVNGKFARFISSCELIIPSVNELKKCEGTIEFISFWRTFSLLNAWKADFLYCISRDLL